MASAPAGERQWTLRVYGTAYYTVDLAQDGVAAQIAYATCLKLANHRGGGGPRSALLVPEAAPFPRISRDGRTYTFDVRPAFTRFSSGERVGPSSFARALVRAANRQNVGSPGASFIADIVGARAAGEFPAATLRGVRVQGAQLVIRLRRPAQDFLARLALPYFCALPRGVSNRALPRFQRLPSAGPYYVAHFDGSLFELRRNPHYRGPRRGGPARIRFEADLFPETAVSKIEAGRFDWLPFAVDARGKRLVHARLHEVPTTSSLVLVFGTRPGRPFANARMRRAAAYAVDRPGTIAGEAAPSDAIIALRPPAYRRAAIYPPRPTEESRRRARQLAQGLTPVAVYGRPGLWQYQERALIESWGSIGIRAGFRRTADCDADADFYILPLGAPYADPASVFRALLDTEAGFGCYWPWTFDVSWRPQFERAQRLQGNARMRALAALETRLLWDAQVVGLGRVTAQHLFAARIGCFRPHRAYQVDLAALCLR